MLAPIVECAGVQTASKLVFHRYGSDLRAVADLERKGQLRPPGPVTATERKLAAGQKAPDETVILALR